MIDIENYVNDGANWQAQAVLAYLRSCKENILSATYDKEYYGKYHAHIEVGRYENCREQGYVFSLKNWGNGKQRNYAVYEHRNSDQIIVLISEVNTINTPSIDDMWYDKGENANKYDYDKSFKCGEIVECGDWIVEDMKTTIAKWGYNE